MSEKDREGLLLALVRQYSSLLRRLTRRYGPSMAAKDVLHDAYLRISGLETVPEIRNHGAYIVRIADSMAKEHVRRETRHVGYPLDDDHALDTPGPDTQFGDKQRLDQLAKAIQDLPPRCREAFLLHKFEGLGYNEVAIRLGISRSAVEKHVMKALSRCRDSVGR